MSKSYVTSDLSLLSKKRNLREGADTSRNYSKILVTGGAGFIGSHLVDRLLRDGFEVTVIDDLSSGNLENVSHHSGKKAFHFIRGGIRKLDLVKRAAKEADAVFHEAAALSWTGSWRSLHHLNQVNVNGTLTVLNACTESSVKRFIFASSAAVYGDAGARPHHEDLSPTPISPYGVSKSSAEQNVQMVHRLYGIETVCLRYFNVYGPRQTYGPYSGVIIRFMNHISKNKPLTIYGDGKQTRDFVNVKDVVDGSMLALTNKDAVGGIFNIGTGKATKIEKLAEILREIMNKTEIKPAHADPRLADIRYSCADIHRSRRVLGYDPKISLRNGLRELIECSGLSKLPRRQRRVKLI